MAETVPLGSDARPLLGRAGLLALAALTTLVLVVAAGLAVVAHVQTSHRSASDARQAAVVAAARQVAVDFTSIDYRSFDADEARIGALSTATLKSTFLSQFAKAEPYITKAKAVSVGTAETIGITSITDTTAVALVALNETVKNASIPKGTVQYDRLQISLTRQGSRWLASALTPV